MEFQIFFTTKEIIWHNDYAHYFDCIMHFELKLHLA